MADEWDDRLIDFCERVMAAAVANEDPRPLQEEYNQMLAQMPAAKKQQLKLLPINVLAPQKAKKPNARPTR